MAVTITTSRQFRKGRVLHGKGDYDIVLVDSPAPRTWSAIAVHKVTGRTSFHRAMSSAALRKQYTHYSLGLTKPMTLPECKDTVSKADIYFGKKMPYQVNRALVSRAGGVGGVVGKVASAPRPPTVEEVIESLEKWSDPLTKPLVPEPEPAAPVLRKRSTSFAVPDLPTKPYWYESENDRRLYRDFIALRKTGHTVNLMVAGPSGAGKTVGIQNLGEELGYPVHIVNCQAITTPEKWLGQMMADPDKGTYFEPSQHLQWVEATAPECADSENCILLYDEITRLRPELNNMTYSLFDTQRGLEVPQMGRRVLMHPKNLIIATANIGAAFAGTFGQDRAFRERFSMTMERPFPPQDEEVKIIESATGIDNVNAKALVRVADATRNLWREQTIESPISTRTLVIWALLVAGGYTVMQAAEYTVLPLYSEDGGVDSDRAKVRLQIEGKVA